MIGYIQTSTNDAVITIQSGLSDVAQGQKLDDEAGQSLRDIISSSKETTKTIMKVTEATQQQSLAADHLMSNMEQVAIVTREFAIGSQEVASQTERINAITDELEKIIQLFSITDLFQQNSTNVIHSIFSHLIFVLR